MGQITVNGSIDRKNKVQIVEYDVRFVILWAYLSFKRPLETSVITYEVMKTPGNITFKPV